VTFLKVDVSVAFLFFFDVGNGEESVHILEPNQDLVKTLMPEPYKLQGPFAASRSVQQDKFRLSAALRALVIRARLGMMNHFACFTHKSGGKTALHGRVAM
jgi:hypothetical protein